MCIRDRFICPDLTAYEREVLCEMATDTGAFTAFAIEEEMCIRDSDKGASMKIHNSG